MKQHASAKEGANSSRQQEVVSDFFKVEGESGSGRVTKFNVAATQFHLEYWEDCLKGNNSLLCARERRAPSERIRGRIGGQGIGIEMFSSWAMRVGGGLVDMCRS